MAWGIIMSFVCLLGFFVIAMMLLASDEHIRTVHKDVLSDPGNDQAKGEGDSEYDQAA